MADDPETIPMDLEMIHKCQHHFAEENDVENVNVIEWNHLHARRQGLQLFAYYFASKLCALRNLIVWNTSENMYTSYIEPVVVLTTETFIWRYDIELLDS